MKFENISGIPELNITFNNVLGFKIVFYYDVFKLQLNFIDLVKIF